MGCTPSKSVSDPQLSDKEKNTKKGQEVEKIGSSKYPDGDNQATDDDTSNKFSENDVKAGSNTKDAINNKYKFDNDTDKLNSINSKVRTQPPTAGVLATNIRQVSESQTEFFRILDEKIEKGRDSLSERDFT